MKTLNLDDRMNRTTLLQRLTMAKEDSELVKLRFFHLDFDDVLAQAVVELLIHNQQQQQQQQQQRKWQKLFLGACQGPGLLLVCETAMPLIPKLELWGGACRLQHAALFTSIGTSLGMANSKLQSLSLKRVVLDNASAEALGQGLQHTQTLEELDLRHSYLGARHDRHDRPGIRALCTGLRQNTTLLSLNMGNCELDDEDVMHLAQALQGHPCLQEWLLECNSCGQEGLRAIATLLQDNRLVKLDLCKQSRLLYDLSCLSQALMETNTSLQVLDLSGNYLGDGPFQILAEMLTINTTLKQLYLYRRLEQVGRYPHTQQGVLALVSALRLHNQTLDTLMIPSKVDDDSLQDLFQELTMLTNFNRAGRRLLNHHRPNTDLNPNRNEIPALGLWPLVLARINTLNWTYRNPHNDGGDPRIPLLHYILRQGPMVDGGFFGGR
jgi:hypothetical protein